MLHKLLILLMLLISGPCQCQELLWEKRIPLATNENLYSIIKTGDENYLACGQTNRWRINTPQGSFGCAVLIKFNEDGDTLWTKFSGYYGGFGKMAKGENGLCYALLGYHDFSNNSDKLGILIFNEDGIVFNLIPIPVTSYSSLYSISYRDGYLWLSGQKNPSISFPAISTSSDFWLMKMRLDGTEVFSFSYNHNYPYCSGEKIEFMPNGNILFSGSVGNQIGAFEIDTSGNEIQYRSYYQTGTATGFQNPSVKQSPSNTRVLSGGKNVNNVVSYLLYKTDTASQKIWGGESPGGTTSPMIFSNGSIIHINNSFNPIFSIIRRLSADSIVMWSLDLLGPDLIQGRKAIRDVWYESDSSGVCVGAIAPTSGGQNLYICKFGGFGVPFDPTSSKALESMKTDAVPIPFPNPGTNLVKFTIVSGPGKVTFTDLQGRKVYEGEYLPEKGIATKNLQPGLYNYRLERNGKVWTGKWVKE